MEDCLDLWDGNHNGFEDQIRPLLNDRGSMETHETRFGIEDYSLNRVVIRMGYSAKNAFGGRVSVEAIGLLDYTTCEVEVLSTGLESPVTLYRPLASAVALRPRAGAMLPENVILALS